MYDWIVFIDFDGTITSEETLSGALKLLDPPGLGDTVDRMLAGKITLSQGLHALFAKVPSARYQEVDAYIRQVPVREGFGDFLDHCRRRDLPVVVISGGLTQMLERKLAPYRDRLLDLHSVWLDLDGDTMQLRSPYDDGVEVMRKTEVMAKYDYRRCVCIGDSYTDFQMARHGDAVFARDELAAHLARSGVPFHPWDNFHDIVSTLKEQRVLEQTR